MIRYYFVCQYCKHKEYVKAYMVKQNRLRTGMVVRCLECKGPTDVVIESEEVEDENKE